MANQEKEARDQDCFELDEDDKPLHEIALARCDCLIRQYLRWKKKNERKSDIALTIALIATALAPLILLYPTVRDDWARFYGAVLTTGAAIATGSLAINGWRDNYIRYGFTWHSLASEKFRYLTGSGKYETFKYQEDGDSCLPDEAATKYFTERMESLVAADAAAWREFMIGDNE